jgi:hypothetical protein
MTDRQQIEQLVRELHMARLEGNLERLCALYADEARLRIAGSTDGKPIAIAAIGIAEIRPWLSILVKTFRLSQYTTSRSASMCRALRRTGASTFTRRSPAWWFPPSSSI